MNIRNFMFVWAVASVNSGVYALDADKVVYKADEGRMPPGLVVFTSSVKDLENGSEVRETRFRVHNKSREKSLVETIYPERQKGRKLLMDNENLWFSTPDVKRPVKVSMQQRLTGEVANGDLARTNFSGDYSAKLVGKETVNGKEVLRLALKAKRSGVTYSKIDYWVRDGDYIPIKAIFYAVSGKPLKSAQYTDIRNMLGKNVITKTVFTDALDKGRKSILVYSNHNFADVPDSFFSKESLGE